MLIFLLLLCVLAGCSSLPESRTVTPGALADEVVSSASIEFRGLYSAGFEEEAFRPCGLTERWWVTNPDSLRSRYADVGASPYEPVYSVIRGDTTQRMPAGHLGLYQRYVRVHEVIHVARLDSFALKRHPQACPNTDRSNGEIRSP
jgi:hypothetical protein